MYIAVFGGTFDPTTLAHETIVKVCLERKDMNEVWLLPSGVRTDKPDMQSDEKRLRLLEIMCKSSFRDNLNLFISTLDLDLPRPTRTRTTVAELDRLYPEHDFWFVFGADAYHNMPSWGATDLRQSMSILLVGRAGYDLPKECGNHRHLNVSRIPEMSISSTLVRQTMNIGGSVRGMVSLAIADALRQ